MQKTLRLTILIGNESAAELANTFGSPDIFYTEQGLDRYVQFRFPSVKMLSVTHLTPIYHLIKNYELTNGKLKFKMLHLQDDENNSSPYNLLCVRGEWYILNTITLAEESKKSHNLFTLI